MKTLKFLLRGLLFIVGFIAAAWFFMPWKQVGEGALLLAVQQLKAPATVAYAAVRGVAGGFAIEGLEARKLMGMADISLKTFTVVPDVSASLLNMTPTCQVAFTGEVLSPLRIALSGGRAAISFSFRRREILLDGLRSDGDLAMDGALLIDLSGTRPIQWAEVAINVKSDALEKEFPSLQMFLPLRQEAPGRWVLRRAKGDAR
jgi:hypothetical protein